MAEEDIEEKGETGDMTLIKNQEDSLSNAKPFQ